MFEKFTTLFGKDKKSVLVIDDDQSLQRLVTVRLIQHEGLDVMQAMDGVSGLKQANNHTPDLIILDWMLPDILGPEILERIRDGDRTKHIPVLMLTGRNKVGDIDDAFELGADSYLTKPFTLQKLGWRVREMLSATGPPDHL